MTKNNMPEKEPPHYYVETTNIGHNEQSFLLWLNTGGDKYCFILTPDHAKQVMRLMQMNVEKYEERFGVLSGRLPSEPMPSPFNGNPPL